MNILIRYTAKKDFKALKEILNSLNSEIKIDDTSQVEQFLDFYDKNRYDYIFIDYIEDESDFIIKYILKNNKEQKIILLNDLNICYDNKNCLYCKENYSIKTVIKPISLFQIGELFSKKFICESYNKTTADFNIEKVKKYVTHKYPFVHFNKQKNHFDLSAVDNPLKTTIIIDLIEIFEVNCLQHMLIEDVITIEKKQA